MSAEIPEILTRLNAEQTKYTARKSKAGATRVRAELLALKKACEEGRRSVLLEAKEIPVKPRKSKLVPVESEETPPAPPELVRQTAEIVEKPKRVRKPTKKMVE